MKIVKPLLNTLFTLWGVITVVFFLFSVLPGDPAQMMLGQLENSEQLDITKKKYGFDLPLTEQYLLYINDISPIGIHPHQNIFNGLASNKYYFTELISFETYSIVLKAPYLRESYQRTGVPVSQIISNTLPNTFFLAVAALLIAVFMGVIFGVISALNKHHFLDYIIQFISTLGMSIPSFLSAILFAWIFGFLLHEFTGLSMTGSFYALDDMGESLHIEWKNIVLPAVVLGIRPLAVVTQLMRNALLEELEHDYFRTARAKGLSRVQATFKHALRNALNPVITALSGWFGSMLAGAVFVEYIFGWNGLGKEIVAALNTLDIPVLMGAVLTVSFLFILINKVVDQLYVWLDPKVKLS